MNMTRIIVLAVALVAGGVAFYLMMGARPQAPTQVALPVEEKTTRILVSDVDLVRGERLQADKVRWTTWPEKALSPSYVTEASGGSPEDLANAVARTTIVKGEPIIESKIVRVGASGMMAAVLEAGMRAVSMRISPETAVSGFILPGDRVDVLFTQTDGRSGAQTRTLFENVKVLAINTIYSENPETPTIEGANVTLEFTPPDAEAFVTARASGTLNLALRSVFTESDAAKAQPKRSGNLSVIRYGRS